MLPPAAVPHAPLGLCIWVSGGLMAWILPRKILFVLPPRDVSLSSFMDVLYFITQQIPLPCGS